jgi:C4-dicarboxylate transporter DctQ subunit
VIRRLLDNLEEVVAAVLVAAICIIVGMEVVLRYILTRPLSWTEELSTILFVWITMLGSSIALKRGEHFAVELVRVHLGPTGQRALRSLTLVLVIVFCGVLIYYGSLFTWRGRIGHTPAMELSRIFPYAAIPVGGALMLVRSLQMLARLWRPSEVTE